MTVITLENETWVVDAVHPSFTAGVGVWAAEAITTSGVGVGTASNAVKQRTTSFSLSTVDNTNRGCCVYISQLRGGCLCVNWVGVDVVNKHYKRDCENKRLDRDVKHVNSTRNF